MSTWAMKNLRYQNAITICLCPAALLQSASIAQRAGVRALLVHAESERAAGFYQRLAIGFEPSATDPLHLTLLMKDLRQAIRDAAQIDDSTNEA